LTVEVRDNTSQAPCLLLPASDSHARHCRIGLTAALLLIASGGLAQERSDGTAIVRVDGTEYTIPIECEDPSRPELGFSSEPSRVTRESTGRTSPVRLTVRPWQDTAELVITLDRYVAWIPSQPSAGGVLVMEFDMSPASSQRDGLPVLLTYDLWTGGERPPGLGGVWFEADCSFRDPAAPASRRLAGAAE
jgi:hypothetical protein